MAHLTETEIQEKLMYVEFGYKQCEAGHNIQRAMEEARNILETDFTRAVEKSLGKVGGA